MALTGLRAGMAMRGSEVCQQTELIGSSTHFALSGADLINPLPLQFNDFFKLLTTGTDWLARSAQAIAATGFRSSCCFVIVAQ